MLSLNAFSRSMLLLPLTRFLALASLAHSQLLKNAAWGLWFRVITGSGLSMVDLATDINVIRVYFGQEGQEGYGWMMLGMVLASLGLQLVAVLAQNGKMGWGKLLREALITVSGLKPGERLRRTTGGGGWRGGCISN
jgi:hypothetical protein